MDLLEFYSLIKKKNIYIVYFTNNEFKTLNNNISILSKEIDESKFLIIDIDQNKKLVEELFIKSIPFFYIYKNGKLIEEIFGNYKNINNIIKLHF